LRFPCLATPWIPHSPGWLGASRRLRRRRGRRCPCYARAAPHPCYCAAPPCISRFRSLADVPAAPSLSRPPLLLLQSESPASVPAAPSPPSRLVEEICVRWM
ncbi:hypothetical protein BRADI_1g23735v3, partial [Brachypodium distachyon]